MKLVHPDFETQINFADCPVHAVFFDDPMLFRHYVSEFSRQQHGEPGSFVLSEDGEEISLADNVVMITDPLFFEIEDKRIVSRMQRQLAATAVAEDMFTQTQEIIASLSRYAESLKDVYPYSVSYAEPEVASIIKMLSFHVAHEYQNEAERLLEYMDLMHDICGIGCFIILNAFSCFSLGELSQLSESCRCKGHFIAYVESSSACSDLRIDFARKIIIDPDGYEIF